MTDDEDTKLGVRQGFHDVTKWNGEHGNLLDTLNEIDADCAKQQQIKRYNRERSYQLKRRQENLARKAAKAETDRAKRMAKIPLHEQEEIIRRYST